MQKIVTLFVFALYCASAQTVTVCEVMMGLEDLNHKEVKVRGTWIVGHVGEVLIPSNPCDHQTVRDGWIWQDAIQVYAETKEAKAFRVNYHRLVEKIDPTTQAKIVATFSGRLETRNHFEVDRGRPVAFADFVALLRYTDVESLVVVPYKPGEQEQELKFRRRPVAKRVK